MHLLAYRPFLDPVDIHGAWYLLLIPMSLLISMAYRAVRIPDMKNYGRAVFTMTVQIVLGMIGLGLGTYLLVEFVLPLIGA